MSKKEDKAEIKAIVIFCKKLNKEIVVKHENLEWTSVGDEAYHGAIYVDAKCECGENHSYIEVDSW